MADLGATAHGPGFFLIAGHGVDAGLIARVFGQAARFFAQPPEAKRALSIGRNPHNRGQAAPGTESLDEHSGQADRNEAFNIGYDLPDDDPRVLAGAPDRGENLWPDLPRFRETMLDYFANIQALGTDLMRAVALNLGLPETRFQRDFDEPMATLRLLSHPAGDPGGMGAGYLSQRLNATYAGRDGG